MSTLIRFLPANDDLGGVLEEVLREHGVVFERDGNLLELSAASDPARVAALMRHVLSAAERSDVAVLEGAKRTYPRPATLDEWGRRLETAWFSRALRENRFGVWFQPLFDTRVSAVMAHECFVQLQAARMHYQPEILETAIARRELQAFDSYARRLAVEAGARQDSAGVFFIPLTAASVYRPRRCLAGTVAAIRESGMAAANVVFAVTEAELIRDSGHVRRICDFLRAEGSRVALNQVGAGTISPSKIRELRPDFVKIHRTLVRNVEQPVCASAIRKLTELAERMESVLVAEGVERVQTMENLWLLGVECMQGFLFGRPAPSVTSPEQDLMTLARVLDPNEPAARALCN